MKELPATSRSRFVQSLQERDGDGDDDAVKLWGGLSSGFMRGITTKRGCASSVCHSRVKPPKCVVWHEVEIVFSGHPCPAPPAEASSMTDPKF